MTKHKPTLDEILQHELQIARLATGSINSIVVPSLEKTYAEIRRIIRERGLPNTPKRLEMLERAIAQAIRDNNGWSDVTNALDEFAQYEAGVALQTTQAFTATALELTAADRIASYINAALMSLESGKRSSTGTWAQFVQGNIDSQIETYNNIIRTGYARGQTLREISRNLQDATSGLLRHNAEALARTGYSHYANAAREAMAQGLSIDTDWVLIFTFDSRRSQTCIHQELTKSRWKSNDPARRIPPLHFNCRTTGIILPRGEELDGMRPAIVGKAGEDAEKSFDRRAKNKTPKYSGRKDKAFDAKRIRYGTSYESFLKSQPDWFIDEVLGATKGKLFRSGKYKLKSFFDMTGRPLTLAELAN